MKLMIPTTLVILSIVGLAAGAVKNRKLPIPAWYELLWFAFNTFMILNVAMRQKDPGVSGKTSEVETEH